MKLMEAAKEYLAPKKIGDVVIDKPFFTQKKFLAMLVLPVLVVLNRKFELQISDSDMMALAIAIGTYIAGQAYHDAAVKTAAIHADALAPDEGSK